MASWIDEFAARHGLDEAARRELEAQAGGTKVPGAMSGPAARPVSSGATLGDLFGEDSFPGLDGSIAAPVSGAMFSEGMFSTGDVALDGTLAPIPAGETGTESGGALIGDHLELIGPIGRGGMGEVLRVHDRRLRRLMALKALHPGLAASPELRARFMAEAQATAQLEHPGIIPVHELGVLPDGRPYFTMKEVQGRTLREVIQGIGGQRWPLRRLVDALGRVCDAVGYAHERGVIHRDLKPDNIMVGGHGEVLVLDWGLVKVAGAEEPGALVAEPVLTDRAENDSLRTRAGQVAGTPRYMSPEQLRGEVLDAGSDVWALGAMLYEIITGRPAFPQGDGASLRAAILAGAPTLDTDDGTDDGPVDEGLVAICARTMAPAPAGRFPDAAALRAALTRWLDGALRRERALAIVAEAVALAPAEQHLRSTAVQKRAEARALGETLKSYAPVAEKRSAWDAEDQAAGLEAQADTLQRTRVQQLQAALSHAPELPEALAALADHHRAKMAAAEARQDADGARRHADRLRFYSRGRHADWLAGEGAVTLVTDPPGAEVRLHRYALRDRRLVPVFERVLGHTPLEAAPLPMGDYLLTLHHPERAVARYPLHLTRCQHWDGVPPGGDAPAVIPLLRPERLGPGDCYVPAGPAVFGINVVDPSVWPVHQRWQDGFVARRFQVTHADYLRFLDDLVSQGREAEALTWAPRERGSRPDQPGPQCYGRDDDGRFVLLPDADGDLWDPQWPAFLVDWGSAMAYAAWESEKGGGRWTLPDEFQWEKAARGVDGRTYPWGDTFDATFACVQGSHPGRPLPARITDFPADESVYGLRGMAGGTRGWCRSHYHPTTEAPPIDPDAPGARMVRGGCFFFPPNACKAAVRTPLHQTNRADTIGFRLIRPLDPADR